MKALTIREPFATLIKDKVKIYETRSWKTNYRGEIYIHAAKARSKASNVSIASTYLKSRENPEHIICKCLLKDCIYMTEEFIKQEKEKNPNNFIAGRYEVGRYAWVLDNIEPIEPIQVKGQLGIWNYKK